MKNFTKFLGITILGLAFGASAFSQATATGTATATILAPIAITNTGNMSFGNVAVNAAGGTVVLTPTGTRSTTGGVTLPAVTGSVTAASFHITGNGNSTYTIAVSPASVDITSGANTMAVGTWTTSPTPTGTLSAAGAEDITVGATLTVTGSQPAGIYTTSVGDEFSVTVNYN